MVDFSKEGLSLIHRNEDGNFPAVELQYGDKTVFFSVQGGRINYSAPRRDLPNLGDYREVEVAILDENHRVNDVSFKIIERLATQVKDPFLRELFDYISQGDCIIANFDVKRLPGLFEEVARLTSVKAQRQNDVDGVKPPSP
jgi:hypothetical protein